MQKAMAGGFALQERVVPGDVTYEALPHGARLTFTTKEVDRTEQFRAQVRARVDLMTKDNCAMMDDARNDAEGPSGSGEDGTP